jgi:hypothetical protein
MRVAVLLVIYIGVLLSPAFAEDDPPQTLRLEFKAELVTEHAREEGKPKPQDETARSSLEVWLYSRGFIYSRADGFQLYDLPSARVAKWSTTGRGASFLTLDAEVDFRRLELYNRTRIRKVLASSGQSRPAFEPFAIETLLGMEQKKGALADQIERTDEEGVVVFTVNGSEVVRIRAGEKPVPEAYRASWVRFVRHRLRIHPLIRREVLALPHMPAEMKIRWVNVGRSFLQTLQLTHMGVSQALLPELPPPAGPGSDPLARALDAAKTAVPTSRKGMRSRLADLEKQGKWLTALLSLLEYSVATGDQPATEMRGLMSRATEKDQLNQLISRLPDLNDKDRAREFRDGLLHLKEREPRYGHLLDLWRANASVTLDEPQVARDLLIDVLSEHPEMAGAWSDLGWLFHRSFKVDDAWRCFTAGLRLAPNHPMLESVVKLRKSLRKDYPEFYD